MNIAYFHVGASLELPELLSQSAKKAFLGKKIKIIQLSDLETPKAKSADKLVRFKRIDGVGMQYFRLVAYKIYLQQFKEPTVFLDTDMLIAKPFSVDFKSGPTLCRRSYKLGTQLYTSYATRKDHLTDFPEDYRYEKISYPEHAGQTFGSFYPYLGCFFADKDHLFLSRCIEIYDTLGENYKNLYGDQFALREAAKELFHSTVPESIVAADPCKIDPVRDVICFRFKGEKLKEKMKPSLERLYPDTKAKFFPSSYRSNPRKKGYEIPETLNSYFSEYLIGASSSTNELVPSESIDIGERADILCKIMLLLSTKENLIPREIGLSVYEKHLNSLNGCMGKDSPEKNGINSYLKSFIDLYDSVKINGKFNPSRSVVPINYEMKVIDGAHRTSIGITLGLSLPVVKLPAANVPRIPVSALTSRFGLSEREYLYALRTYLRFNKEAKIIVLFPRRDNSKDNQCMSLISRYLRIDAKLEPEIQNSIETKTIISLLYAGQDWLRGKISGMDALNFKVQQVHKDTNRTTFLVVTPHSCHQEFNLQKHKDLKELCRSKYSIGFHSLHGTDCREDNLLLFDNYLLRDKAAIPMAADFEVATSLLNKNQLDALDYFSSLDLFQRERLVISGGMVLACMGLRSTSDIDIITDINNLKTGTSHNDFVTKWSRHTSYKEFLSDPAKTFWMKHKNKILRFLSLNELIDLKIRRYKSKPSEKDRADIEIISKLTSMKRSKNI